MAWKASSASCGSRRIPRQTLRTIGPCRPRSASKDPGVPVGEETLEELRVGEPRDHSIGEQAVDLSQGGAQCLDGHVPESPRAHALYSM